METDLSSSTETVLPEDSSDPDFEVQALTRMEDLNSVNITEGTEMENVLQMMAVLGVDEASHILTRAGVLNLWSWPPGGPQTRYWGASSH